eukprot:2629528-Rhodomonas_salina.1
MTLVAKPTANTDHTVPSFWCKLYGCPPEWFKLPAVASPGLSRRRLLHSSSPGFRNSVTIVPLRVPTVPASSGFGAASPGAAGTGAVPLGPGPFKFKSEKLKSGSRNNMPVTVIIMPSESDARALVSAPKTVTVTSRWPRPGALAA